MNELESTAPELVSACTATLDGEPLSGIAVSNPRERRWATVDKLVTLGPPSTRHRATSVAPFQLV